MEMGKNDNESKVPCLIKKARMETPKKKKRLFSFRTGDGSARANMKLQGSLLDGEICSSTTIYFLVGGLLFISTPKTDLNSGFCPGYFHAVFQQKKICHAYHPVVAYLFRPICEYSLPPGLEY